MKHFTEFSGPRPVRRRVLAETLRTFRNQRNEVVDDLAHRFHTVSETEIADRRYGGSRIAETLQKRGVDALEEGGEGSVDLTYRDCEFLASIYGVHRLLLDPVLAIPSDDACYVGCFGDFLSVGDPSTGGFARLATYGIPDRILVDTENVSIVSLRIEPGGRSDSHWHAGDELMFVRSGSVDVLLRSSGLRARLHEWDYVHFYAEQEHCAYNATDLPADLFILRFRPVGRRFELLRELHARRPKPPYVSRAVRELLATVAPYPDRERLSVSDDSREGDGLVVDRYGLGRLLQLVCTEGYCRDENPPTLDELARRAEALGQDKASRLNRARLHRLHHGLSPVSEAELLQLAAIYDIKPMLLYDYLSPVVRNAIAVRHRGERQLSPDDAGDMCPVPAPYVRDSQAVYRVPCRRLADSDLAIAATELPKGASTPENRHPGHEILLPLVGIVELRFGTTLTRINAARGEFAHFHSHRRHWLLNVGDGPAHVLVIRIYE
jgi:quercetin dioxygenase-like cupin family protein